MNLRFKIDGVEDMTASCLLNRYCNGAYAWENYIGVTTIFKIQGVESTDYCVKM